MKRKIAIVLICTLVSIGLLSGCVGNTRTIRGKVINIEGGGGSLNKRGNVVEFDTGEIIICTTGLDKIIINKTGVFTFIPIFGYTDEYDLYDVQYG